MNREAQIIDLSAIVGPILKEAFPNEHRITRFQVAEAIAEAVLPTTRRIATDPAELQSQADAEIVFMEKDEACAFKDCPPGHFLFSGALCFKSEYSTGPGQADAYCENGEYFWGGVGPAARRDLIVVPVRWSCQKAEEEVDRCDYEISDDGVMSATAEWTRDNDATALRLLACHSVDVSDQVIATWTDAQVKQADIWAWSCALSASDNDDIQVPPRPDFLPEALGSLRRHPITGEPL